MTKVKIHNKGSRLHLPTGLQILPGANEIDSREWEAAGKLPAVKNRLKDKTLEELKAAPKKVEPKEDKKK